MTVTQYELAMLCPTITKVDYQQLATHHALTLHTLRNSNAVVRQVGPGRFYVEAA